MGRFWKNGTTRLYSNILLTDISVMRWDAMGSLFSSASNRHLETKYRPTTIGYQGERGPGVVVTPNARHAKARGLTNFQPLEVVGHGSETQLEVAGNCRQPLWYSGFKEQNVSSPPTSENSVFWGPRGSVLDLRSPGRILCVEGSVIRFISPSPGLYKAPAIHYFIYYNNESCRIIKRSIICLVSWG